MSLKLRKDVLKAFKALHRARTTVFEGDDYALQEVRNKINEEFKKNKKVTNEESIQEMIKFSNDVGTELRTSVVQAREVEPGKFEVRIREETTKLDNFPYQDVPEEVLLGNRKKGSKLCTPQSEGKTKD